MKVDMAAQGLGEAGARGGVVDPEGMEAVTIRRFCHHCGERLTRATCIGTCQCDDVSRLPARFDVLTGARLDLPPPDHASLLGNAWRTGPLSLHDLTHADGRASRASTG